LGEGLRVRAKLRAVKRVCDLLRLGGVMSEPNKLEILGEG
jgi:hypothetical protein